MVLNSKAKLVTIIYRFPNRILYNVNSLNVYLMHQKIILIDRTKKKKKKKKENRRRKRREKK